MINSPGPEIQYWAQSSDLPEDSFLEPGGEVGRKDHSHLSFFDTVVPRPLSTVFVAPCLMYEND